MITNKGEAPYDYLVLATGAAMRPQEIPGLSEHALTLWTAEEMLRLREGLGVLVEKARLGQCQKLLFLVPPNNKCSGPLYELVLMTDTWLRREHVRDQVELTWSTFEESYIQAFGPRLNTVVMDEFSERRVGGHKGFIVTSIEPGLVHYQNGEKLPYDCTAWFDDLQLHLYIAPPVIVENGYLTGDADREADGFGATVALSNELLVVGAPYSTENNFVCTPTLTAGNVTCAYQRFWVGDQASYGAKNVDALYSGALPTTVTASVQPSSETPLTPAEAQADEDADDQDVPEGNQSLFLPVIEQ